jgi:hypothetical protein
MSPTSCQTAPPRGAECTGTTAVRQTKPFGGSIAALQYLVTHRDVHLQCCCGSAPCCSPLFRHSDALNKWTPSAQSVCGKRLDTKQRVSVPARRVLRICCGLCRRLASVGQPSTRLRHSGESGDRPLPGRHKALADDASISVLLIDPRYGAPPNERFACIAERLSVFL